MRRAARVDSNQNSIVKALRAIGASVQHLHAVGKGCPDILVGFRGHNLIFEIKDGDKSPSQRKLTPDEQEFFQAWEGQYDVVESIEEAINTLLARTINGAIK